MALDVLESKESKTLLEFAKLSKVGSKSLDNGEEWLRQLCNNKDPFNRRDTSNDQHFYR